MSETSAISTTSRRKLLSSFFFLQGKAPKEIHAILSETLVCFLPGRAKDLSAPLYKRARGDVKADDRISAKVWSVILNLSVIEEQDLLERFH